MTRTLRAGALTAAALSLVLALAGCVGPPPTPTPTSTRCRTSASDRTRCRPSPSIRSRRSRPSSRDLRRLELRDDEWRHRCNARLPVGSRGRGRNAHDGVRRACLQMRTTTARTTSRPALRIAGTASSSWEQRYVDRWRVSSTSSRSRVQRSWSSSPLLPLATSRCPRREVIRPAAAGMSSSPSPTFAAIRPSAPVPTSTSSNSRAYSGWRAVHVEGERGVPPNRGLLDDQVHRRTGARVRGRLRLRHPTSRPPSAEAELDWHGACSESRNAQSP